MTLINHEVCDEDHPIHRLYVKQVRKLFSLAEGQRCGLRQIGGRVNDEYYDHELNQQKSVIKDIVRGLCNEDISFLGETVKKNLNMPEWALVSVHNGKLERIVINGWRLPTTHGFFVLVPIELLDDVDFVSSLVSDRPSGFRPDAWIYDAKGIKHLGICYEHEICVDCGRPGYPHCEIHNPDYLVKYFELF